MDKVYVLGGAQTDFERNWSKEGKGLIALLKEVIDDSLKNANLTYDQIDDLNKENRIACFSGNFIGEYYINQGHTGSFLTEVNKHFYGVPCARYEAACASGSVALDSAITKIKCGDYDVAIVVGWELMKTVDSKTCGDFLGRAAYYEKEAKGIDYPFPKLFGKLANATLDKYNINKEIYLRSLATISTINYANAKRNPNAQTRKWFMNLEQANLRGTETNSLVGGELAVSDCSQITDGAACVVLISEKLYNLKYKNKNLPFVKGWGHRVAPLVFDDKIIDSASSEYILKWTRQTVIDAYKRADMNADDIDFFETHDCFTSSEYMAVSSFGLVQPGKEYKYILDGHIAFDGKTPINPSGGLIGCGHPVGASGVRMFLDLFKQLTNQADTYQLNKEVRNGLMLNIGGSATTNYVFILGNDTTATNLKKN